MSKGYTPITDFPFKIIYLNFIGIRFFEIAELFCNAHIINEALIEEGMDRTDIYIALKVWPKNRTADMLYNACKQIIEQSKLQVFFH